MGIKYRKKIVTIEKEAIEIVRAESIKNRLESIFNIIEFLIARRLNIFTEDRYTYFPHRKSHNLFQSTFPYHLSS